MTSSVSIQNADGGPLAVHTIALGAGFLGAALGVAMVVPQLVRVLRNPTAPGVSATTWALTGLGCLAWLLYGIRAHEPPQVPGNVLIVVGAVLIVLAVPSRVSVRGRIVRLAPPALALVALAPFVVPDVLAYLAFGIGLVSALPQTIKSLSRSRRGESGVSVPAWLLRGASQISWLVYALAIHDAAVAISATVILASAILLVSAERFPGLAFPRIRQGFALSERKTLPNRAELAVPACPQP